MADTPRGPRPTVSRRVARTLLLAWIVAAALLVAAALVPARMQEDDWTRHQLPIVKLPYGDCSGGRGCTLDPTVELPSGERTRVRLHIRAEEELLPSRHFRLGGTLRLWLHDTDEDRRPRASRPTTDAGTVLAWSLLAAALLVAGAAGTLAIRARREHRHDHAGHVHDHLVVRAVPVAFVLLAIVLLLWTLHRTTPRHDPRLPPDPVAARGS